ncbi:MAG: DUF4136 domain-containing protein [Spongiibacteraceae bacterium]
MKAWAKTAVALLTVLWLGGCGGIPVNTDYDSDYQMSPTASYAWIDSPKKAARDPLIDNDLLERRVHRAVDEQLAANGLRPVNDGQQPDLLVAYHVGQEDKVDINTTDNFYGHYGYYPCWHCWGPSPYGYGYGQDVWVNYYTEDTLLIDIIDAKTKKLVWRGMADRRLPKFKTPVERDTYVRETVTAIFQYFPPGRTPRK